MMIISSEPGWWKMRLMLISTALLISTVGCVSSNSIQSSTLVGKASAALKYSGLNYREVIAVMSIHRGGDASNSTKKKKKKKKKNTKKGKKALESALKEKDSAEALGDAIRDRADVLRDEDPLLLGIDWSIKSLGHSLGASDQRMDTDGGGVEAAKGSVVANYFLKSHGGAHAVQCACSLLATLSGLGAIAFRKRKTGELTLTLLQRTMLFAMIKHVSGLLVAASLAAKAIPKIGLRQARVWMEKLVMDPVSQYVFYTALILLWLPSRQRWLYRWWSSLQVVPPLLVGPVVIREVISSLLVVSDILVLCSYGGEDSIIQTILKVSQSAINAGMSLLVSPQIWRQANPAERQAILAKLVAKVSLGMEVLVGLILSVDFLVGFFEFAFARVAHRPSLMETLKRLLCVRLYIHFLWVRRQKIETLAVKVRGGAIQFPFWFTDKALHPLNAMGVGDWIQSPEENRPEEEGQPVQLTTWQDYASVAMGLDK